MQSDFAKILIIGTVALVLYYIVHNSPYSAMGIRNEGEVNMAADLPENAGRSAAEGYAQPSMPAFNPQQQPGKKRPSQGQPQIQDNIRQSDDSAPDAFESMPQAQFVPGRAGNQPTTGNQMNPSKQNPAPVLSYPQPSTSYSQQQAGVNGQFQIKTGKQPSLDCFPKDTVTAQELLPRMGSEDAYNTWEQVNPTVSGHLADRNFVESATFFGIDTVGGSLRNANYQLRSDPVCPQTKVSPWLNSTIQPDTNRVTFEIGADCY